MMRKIIKSLFNCFTGLLLILISSSVYGQASKTISGKVISAQNNKPLPGVNILLKGQKAGTTTDKKGQYQLDVPQLNGTLIFSFVGFKKQEIAIKGRDSINVEMQSKRVKGKEVVVVGYGSQARKDLTGSVESVSSEELDDATISTPDQALQGRVSGVNVHTNSHAPGGNISVNIRGTASLTAGGSPLYVIDGVPISNNFRTGSGDVGANGANSNPLNSIDASDIASVQVLKDASATAIYGSRGANGVVLITTKEGRSGQQQVDFETSLGISNVSNKLNLMNARQYALQRNEGKMLRDKPPLYTDEQVNNFGAGTDWQDVVFRRALQQKYKLTFSGGTDSLRYFISGNMMDNEGVIRNSSLNRYGIRANIDADISKRLKVSSNLSYTATDNHMVTTDSKGYGLGPGLITALVQAAPTIPARDEDGNPTILRDYPAGGQSLGSPLMITDRYKELANTDRFLGNIYGKYQLVDNLSLKVSIGGDVRNWRFHQYYPIGSAASGGQNGKANQINERTVNIVNNNALTYQNDFNNIHSLKVLAGFTYQTQKDELLNASSFGFPSDFYKYNNLGIGTNPQSPGSNANRYTLISYLGRINYSLYDKYLLTASFRVDGDSKFGENKKYGTFPSVAVAWQLGNEKFIKNLGIFSHLKFRIGYGKTGNEAIGTYQSQALIGTAFSNGTGYVYNGELQPVAYPDRIANPNLSWEKTSEWNYGLDMGFFN